MFEILIVPFFRNLENSRGCYLTKIYLLMNRLNSATINHSVPTDFSQLSSTDQIWSLVSAVHLEVLIKLIPSSMPL
jgi:hypothetical protein